VGSITRWHSDVDALEQAFILRESLDEYIITAVREEQQKRKGKRRDVIVSGEIADDTDIPELVSADKRTLDDWEDLMVILSILSPFKQWALHLQGLSMKTTQANSYLADVIPAMNELLKHLELAKQNYSDPYLYSSHLLSSINLAWGLLDRYYTMTDMHPVRHSAVALHPDMKLGNFEQEWSAHRDWIELGRMNSTNLWETEFRDVAQVVELPQTPAPSLFSKATSQVEENILRLWKQHKQARLSTAEQEDDVSSKDQFLEFQNTTTKEVNDLITFWSEWQNSPRWCRLAHMALTVHSIPAMSTEVVRLFSSAKILISDRRNCLGDDLIVAVACLKSSERAGLVEIEEVRQVEALLHELEKPVNKK